MSTFEEQSQKWGEMMVFEDPLGTLSKKTKMGGVLGAKFGPNLIDTVKKAEKVALSISFFIFCIGNTFRNKI